MALSLFLGDNQLVEDDPERHQLSLKPETNRWSFFLNTPLTSSENPQFRRTGELNRVFANECNLGQWRILADRDKRP